MAKVWFNLLLGLALLGGLVVPITIMLLCKYALVERRRRHAEREGLEPPADAASWTWRRVRGAIGWTTTFAVLLWFCLSGPIVLILVGAVVVVFALVYVGRFLRYRWRTRFVRQAFQRAGAGDTDGAISFLHSHIEVRGPSAENCEGLAALLSLQNRWQEVLPLLDQADALAGSPDPLRQFNKALALWKLGRLHEALPLMRAAQRHWPDDLNILCQLATLLHDLGSVGEAVRLYTKLGNKRSGVLLTGLYRQDLDQRIEELRKRLVEQGALAPFQRAGANGGQVESNREEITSALQGKIADEVAQSEGEAKHG
jgi:tetratricopeptide (TPR) repeat protein